MSAQAPNNSNRLALLDGMRGLAALVVLSLHCETIEDFKVNLPHGHLAVDFFFLLSGYVIAKAYESRLLSSMSFRDFAVTRIIRLYPMIFAGAAVGIAHFFIRFALFKTINLQEYSSITASALVLMPSVTFGWGSNVYPLNPPEWSLFFEVAVSFAYAALIRHLTTPRLIVVTAATFVALAFVVWIEHGLNFGYLSTDFLYGFFRVTFPFSLGVILYRSKINLQIKFMSGFALIMFLLFVLVNPCFGGRIYDLAAVALVLPAIMLLGASCKTGPRLATACLAAGELSYPLYLVHHPIMFMAGRFAAHRGIDAPWTIAILSAAVSIMLAAALLVLWDRPVRKWASGVARGESAVTPAQA